MTNKKHCLSSKEIEMLEKVFGVDSPEKYELFKEYLWKITTNPSKRGDK